MSSWTDRVANHALQTERNNLEQTLARIEQLDMETVAVAEELGRIRHVLRFVGRALDAVDPELLTQAMLDGLHSRLSQLHAQLQQYEQSKSPAVLSQGNAQADVILDNVYQLPRLVLDDVVGVRESVTDMRRSMGQLVRHLREEADATAAEVKALRRVADTLKTEIQNREVRLDNAVERVQDTFAETQATRATEFQKTMQRFEEEWKQVEEKREKLLADAIDGFMTDGVARVEEAEVSLEQALGDATRRWVAFESSTNEQSATLLSGLHEQQNEAVKIVGLIAQTGMAGGFQKNANSERTAANRWAMVATVALAILVGLSSWFAMAALKESDTASIHWEMIIAKLVVTFSLAGLAGYAGRESSHHRVAERRYRQAELELSSLSPFLGDLDEKDRHGMLKQFAERFFGQPLTAPPTPKAPQLPIKDTLELIKALKG